MVNYKKMYFIMCSAADDAITKLSNIPAAMKLLKFSAMRSLKQKTSLSKPVKNDENSPAGITPQGFCFFFQFKKSLSFLLRLGWRSLRRAFASI